MRGQEMGQLKGITITLDENQAWDLAQFFKRITWSGVEDCAVDKAETETMIAVIENTREQMAKQGISPR
jgi:hypothetical protein